ncbi:hypothetical protein PFLUV_G00091770 [Perca fluviatilis]|uniref:Uncharacterized protein n=1 Tax=Perca fluviatilis TaxID=8168 RepID=A0A6A5F5I7_PERFL|nr:hypothetical protein PFLUV_G00091770 [Perca fluviatilis]
MSLAVEQEGHRSCIAVLCQQNRVVTAPPGTQCRTAPNRHITQLSHLQPLPTDDLPLLRFDPQTLTRSTPRRSD